MKRNNKKGFTIVELVIVIAVIAILAGVLIPTFGGIVDKAKENAALQEAKSRTDKNANRIIRFITLLILPSGGTLTASAFAFRMPWCNFG